MDTALATYLHKLQVTSSWMFTGWYSTLKLSNPTYCTNSRGANYTFVIKKYLQKNKIVLDVFRFSNSTKMFKKGNNNFLRKRVISMSA